MIIPGPAGVAGTPSSVLTVVPVCSNQQTFNQHGSCTSFVTVSGGVAPYSYSWTPVPDSVIFSSPSSASSFTSFIEGSQTQTYTVAIVVTDANGNVGTGSTTISFSFPDAPV